MAYPPAANREPAPLRITLLGKFHITRGDIPIIEEAWQRRSARMLIKVLATVPEHRLHREQMEELLWPDAPPSHAYGQFRKAVHYARHALEPGLAPRQPSAYLQLTNELISLDPDRCEVDADAFEALASAALASGELHALRDASACYTGELLPEDRYEDWSATRREALARLYHALLLEAASIHAQRGERSAAIDLSRRLLQADPTREDVHRQVMQLAAKGGDRHAALRQYHLCRSVLDHELDTEPEPATRQLYRDILAGRIAADIPVSVRLPSVVRRQVERPLVNRHDALALLREDLQRAMAGEGRAVLVQGEMGVGKSRLLAELATLAHERGTVVLWGSAWEQEDRLPLAPMTEALDGFLAAQPEAERQRIATEHPVVTALVPCLGPLTNDPPHPGGDQRAAFFASVVRLLAELSRTQPLLVVLDALHAADTLSLQLLHHLARSAQNRNWLIAGAHRDDVEAGSALQQLAVGTGQDDPIRRIVLPRLSRAACGQVLADLMGEGAMIDGALVDGIYTRSLGNPFFAIEIARALRERGAIVQRGTRWALRDPDTISVPEQVRELIKVRVDRLGDTTSRLLTLLAAAGPSAAFPLLCDASGGDEPMLLDALDTALTARMIEERDEGYAFVHPLFRSVLYERTTRSRRASMHAALGRAVEAAHRDSQEWPPEAIEALAHHWTEAGEPTRAVPYLIDAADHAARVFANEDAVHRLQRALALLDEPAFPDEAATRLRAGVQLRLGDVYALTGNTALARHAYHTALATGDLPSLEAIEAHRLAAGQSLAMNDTVAAEEHVASAHTILMGTPPNPERETVRLRLQVTAAQAHFLTRRFQAALDVAEASVRLAEHIGSDADRAQAMEMASMACLPLGLWERGVDYERRHADLVDLNRFVRDIADVHFCFGEYHAYAHQPARAARTFERAIAEAKRMDAPRSIALCHYYLGVMAFFHGRFREALTHEVDAIANYQRVGSPFGEAIARQIRGVSLTALGQLDAGRAELERGLNLSNAGVLRSHAQIRLYAGLLRNRIDANDAADARRYADVGLALSEEPSTCICYASFLPGAAVAYAITGDLERAFTLGHRALATARAFESPAFTCMAQQANATVAALSGRWAAAFTALDEAQRLAVAHDFPYELARLLLVRSFVHLQRRNHGDRRAATRLMGEASSQLLRLGIRVSAAQMRSSVGFLRAHAG